MGAETTEGAGLAAGAAAGTGAVGVGLELPVAEVGELLSNGLNPKPAEKAGMEINAEISIAENLSTSGL